MPPRLPLPKTRLLSRPRPQTTPRRPYSSHPTTESKTHHRFSKLLDRMPKFLHPYTAALRHAPGTHITSFLILHELTAIIPLIVLGAGFHYSGWLPGNMNEQTVIKYMTQFGSYFSRKGWFGVSTSLSTDVSSQRDTTELEANAQSTVEGVEHKGGSEEKHTLTHEEEDRIIGEGKYGQGTRIVLEVATAYAITKAMLPIRIIGSVWATPWFARRVLGTFRRFRP